MAKNINFALGISVIALILSGYIILNKLFNENFKLVANSKFTVPEVKLHQLTNMKYENISELSIIIDTIENQINQPEIQLFTGKVSGYWNNYTGDIIHGVYDSELNIGKIVETGKNDNQKTQEEIGFIDFKLINGNTMNIIAYNLNENIHHYLYGVKLYKQ